MDGRAVELSHEAPAPEAEPPLRLLLVEDDDGDALLTQTLLERAALPVTLERARGVREAYRRLEQPWDLLLVDQVLEDGTGLELVRELSRRGLEVPVVLLTGKGSRGLDLTSMHAGVADYLVKGSTGPELLERSIRFSVERSRSARALRESEARHRSTFDHLPVALYRSTPDGGMVEVNPALARLLGHPDRETLEQVYSRALYVHPEDADRFRELLVRDGVVRDFETRLAHASGSVIAVRNSARLHRAADGSILYVEGALEDVTDLLGAAHSRAREEQFGIVFETSGLGIGVVAPGGTISEINPSLLDLVDRERRDVVGSPVSVLFSPGEGPEVESVVGGLRPGAEPSAGERLMIRPDGREFWARVTFAATPAHRDRWDVLLLVEDAPEL